MSAAFPEPILFSLCLLYTQETNFNWLGVSHMDYVTL